MTVRLEKCQNGCQKFLWPSLAQLRLQLFSFLHYNAHKMKGIIPQYIRTNSQTPFTSQLELKNKV